MSRIALPLYLCLLLLVGCRSAPRPDVLCIYYPEWHVYPEGDVIFGKGHTEWDLVNTATPRFPGHDQPIRLKDGCPDDSNPADVAKEIDYAADAGIDAFLYDWYWADHHPIQHEALENGFLKAPNRSRMRFALMWAYHDRTDAFRPAVGHTGDRLYWKLAHTPEEFREAIGYCVGRYFKQPNYYLRNGELFFSIYAASRFVKTNGGPEKVRGLFAEAQEMARAAGLPRIHFSAMVWTPGEAVEVSEAGFESTSAYCMSTDFFADGDIRPLNGERVFKYSEFVATHKSYNASIAAASPAHMPVAARGWDISPRCRLDEPFPWRQAIYPYNGIVHGATPEGFAEILRAAREQAEADPKRPGAVLINAWNEYTEGSYLMPDVKNGDAYLRAVRSVFGKEAK
ncbi:MAG: glycoside hydrolase family 99-like domain-containing protein [Kiritimatiellae bacterium]|nr:glycoside hydrolase family 99-like domain-containing protein [Kiritimatiellia bacterium]